MGHKRFIASRQHALIDAINLIPQFRTLWCWAACAQMVSTSSGPTPQTESEMFDNQCKLVNDALNLKNCCDHASIPECNKALSILAVEGFWKSLGLKSEYANGPLSSDELRKEIDNGTVVQVGWKYGLSGHVVLVVGYVERAAETRFIVHNPWPPNIGDTAVLAYSQLLSAEDQGTWKWTWKGIGK